MTDDDRTAPRGPMRGVTVVDVSTVLAGPLACQILGDFGADVIKVEHPQRPDTMRNHGHEKDGVGLWWKMIGRNKRCLALDLKTEDGAEILRELVAEADVLVENFRPGTLERWGLAPDRLREHNPGLVVTRVTGFGQTGPYARRPAFGTLMESMSGFAAMTGQPDGPPTLPPFGLADSIAGMAAANATLMALYERDANGGKGQDVDVSILEPITAALGPHLMVWDQLGIVPERLGNRSANNAPRNVYRTRDDHWVAISTSATPIAERVLRLVGHPEVLDEDWFASGRGRAEHGDLLDGWVAEWIAARDRDDVITAFEEADAAVAPIYHAGDYLDDPQVRAAEMVVTVPDDELGEVTMQNVLHRMTDTPGAVRHTGRGHGEDTDAILAELGYDAASIADLRSRDVVA